MRKIAIVTGCTSGIGFEISLELARRGYDIIGTYNTSLEKICSLSKKIDVVGVKFYYFKVDLINNLDIDNFCSYIRNNFKHIDLLINNAALELDCEFDLKTREEFIDILKVNLVAPFSLIQKLYKIMNDGIIINISSTDGIDTYNKLNIDYSASKAALINLTKSLSITLDDVKICAICPNFVNTKSVQDMNQDYLKEEMKRIGQHKLIDPKFIAYKIIKVIQSDIKSGSIIVVEDSYE